MSTRYNQFGDMLKLLLGVWLGTVMLAMFLWVPPHEGLGNLGRIIIVHVPTAWVTVLAFLISAIYSGLYLRRRRPEHDDRALAAAEAGLLFSILATVTGSVFAKAVWGSFWNWDPRETSIFVLLLIYAAYLALRSAIEDDERRRRLAAVYSLLAFITVPFLIFVIPRIAESTLHPNCALLATSNCEGVTLGLEGSGAPKVSLLGERKVELLDIQERDGVAIARVEVTEPGATSRAILEPSINQRTGQPVEMPEIGGTRFRLKLERLEGERASLNIEQPGSSGLLRNSRTLLTFLASLAGFTGLFYWIYRVRAAVLGIQGRLAEEGVL
ncbi:MAG: cytochrome c biogenesis protein [Herpetosiphonaceae bacterium]|nr:MAG: cytochrome c biogenesis protein [Herpetosiphonaceae bacterium]